MAYTKTVWEDLPSTNTPLNATNLNNIENELEKLDKDYNYSTTEQVVGTWINNKPIYRKVIDIGNLPNNSSKQIAHSISNLGFVTDMDVEVNNGSLFFKLPFISTAGLEYTISYNIDSTNITITTGTDRSAFSGYAIIDYTKSND